MNHHQLEEIVNRDQLVNQRLSLIVGLKDNSDWLENLENCQLICETVNLLDGSSLNHLYTLTPFILRLTDHHEPENKLKGLNCLTNLMNCYAIGDLESANFHQLFWSTLKTLLFTDDNNLIKSLIPTMLRFIEKFSLDQSEIDECFNQLIRKQLLTSDQTLKTIYMDGINQFLDQWKSELIKFTKSLLQITLNVMEETINQDTYELIVSSFKVLQLITSETVKLSYIYADQLLLSFIKLKYHLMDSENNLTGDQRNNLNGKIESCLLNMKSQNPKLLTDYINLIKERLPQDEYDTNFVITFLMNCQNH